MRQFLHETNAHFRLIVGPETISIVIYRCLEIVKRRQSNNTPAMPNAYEKSDARLTVDSGTYDTNTQPCSRMENYAFDYRTEQYLYEQSHAE